MQCKYDLIFQQIDEHIINITFNSIRKHTSSIDFDVQLVGNDEDFSFVLEMCRKERVFLKNADTHVLLHTIAPV